MVLYDLLTIVFNGREKENIFTKSFSYSKISSFATRQTSRVKISDIGLSRTKTILKLSKQVSVSFSKQWPPTQKKLRDRKLFIHCLK